MHFAFSWPALFCLHSGLYALILLQLAVRGLVLLTDPHFSSLEKLLEVTKTSSRVLLCSAVTSEHRANSMRREMAREASLIFFAFERPEMAASVQAVVPCHHSADPCKSPFMHAESLLFHTSCCVAPQRTLESRLWDPQVANSLQESHRTKSGKASARN